MTRVLCLNHSSLLIIVSDRVRDIENTYLHLFGILGLQMMSWCIDYIWIYIQLNRIVQFYDYCTIVSYNWRIWYHRWFEFCGLIFEKSAVVRILYNGRILFRKVWYWCTFCFKKFPGNISELKQLNNSSFYKFIVDWYDSLVLA